MRLPPTLREMVGLNPNESRCVGLNYMCRDEVWELLKVTGLGKNIDRGHAASASPTWTSRKQDSYACRFRFYFWLNSAVTFSIACCTYRSITTCGRLPFPLAYLKRVMGEGPSCPITRWNSRHIFSQLQDVFFLRLSSFLGSVSSFGADFFVFTESFGQFNTVGRGRNWSPIDSVLLLTC